MKRFVVLAIAACAPKVDPPPLGRSPDVPSFCVVLEGPPCKVHEETVNGKKVTVVPSLHCEGPRSVECRFANGKQEVIPGEASDVVGLGGGRFRYLSWHDDKTTLVTVEPNRRHTERGGAAQPFRVFDSYGLVASSRDGRIQAVAEENVDDEKLVALAIKDTVNGTTLSSFAIDLPIKSAQARVAISADGRLAGICARIDRALAFRTAERTFPLPGNRCRAFAPDLSWVVVERGFGALEAVHLSSGRTLAFAGIDAAFVGTEAVVARNAEWARPPARSRPDNRITFVRLDSGKTTTLGEVPFKVDEMSVGVDGRAVVFLRKKFREEPARAYAFRLPDGPGFELQLSAAAIEISLIP